MTTGQQLQTAPIATSIENVDAWSEIAAQFASGMGVPPAVTPEILLGMIAGAVPLLFEADAAKDMNPLRGTFADTVIAQCQRNAGCLEGQRPSSAVIHLVGAHMVDGHCLLRAHLIIQVQAADGRETTARQFWDLRLGAQVTVGQPSCPNCGAPAATGALICEHCQADLRSVVEVPLAVSRIELY
jgi:hypothetical protein